MTRKRALMVVMNTLSTDARVQRAASAISSDYDLYVMSLGLNEEQTDYCQEIIELKSKNSILRYLEFIWNIKKVLLHDRFALVYLHDYYTAELCYWIKKKFPDIKVVYDAHELIIPEEGYKQSLRDKFFYKKETNAIKVTDLIICASEQRAIMMKKHYGLNITPTVIENISILNILDDDYSRNLIQKCKDNLMPNLQILCYAGALTASRNIDSLIEAVADNKNVQLLVIGDGPELNRLREYSNEKICGRSFFLGRVPYSYLGSLLSICHVGYISYPMTNINNIYCAPNKVYEYASVELPMIAPYNLTLEKIFDEHKIGVINNDLSLALKTVSLDIKYYKKNCRVYIDNNSWEKSADLLRKQIKRLFI